MKRIIVSIAVCFLAVTARGQGCLPLEPTFVIRGMTSPGCVYDCTDSIRLHGNSYMWGQIDFWTDSVYFAEAIPFNLWQNRKLLLLSDAIWGNQLCKAVQMYSMIRCCSSGKTNFEIPWHTQLYIEAVATRQDLGVYVITDLRILQPFNGQVLGIEKL